MIQIKQAVIVEGKYDKIKLETLLDTLILETEGFRIFKDKEKQKLLRRLAETRGLLILTDSDAAGFKIRNFIGGSLPPGQVQHAYIPDVFGKEKRKAAPSKEGKLGVEGLSQQQLLEALLQAGAACESDAPPRRQITKLDLYEDGLTGGRNSRSRRAAFLRQLNLPQRLSSNALPKVLNSIMDYEEYRELIDCIKA